MYTQEEGSQYHLLRQVRFQLCVGQLCAVLLYDVSIKPTIQWPVERTSKLILATSFEFLGDAVDYISKILLECIEECRRRLVHPSRRWCECKRLRCDSDV